jgi:hypothetical protein
VSTPGVSAPGVLACWGLIELEPRNCVNCIAGALSRRIRGWCKDEVRVC